MDIFTTRTECPVCDGTHAKELYSSDLLDENVRVFVDRKIGDPEVLARFRGTSYTLLKCENCGLIYQRNILSDRFLETLYDEWVVHREETPRTREFFGYYANELFTIASLFEKPVHEIKVLDYGLGAGKWAKVAKAIGFDIWGTDLSENLLEDARRDGINTLKINELGKHQFDFINTEQVFEHLARPKETLSQLVPSLAPGGIVKISVPDGTDIEKRLPLMDWSAPRNSKRFLLPATPLVHINTFTRSVIKHMGGLFQLTPTLPALRNEYGILDLTSAKSLAKGMLRPIYRRLTKPTYVFLRKSAGAFE